jgi:SAM-dependent MidA family methyltransferase
VRQPPDDRVLYSNDFLIRLGILDEMESLANAGTAASIERLQSMKKLILPGNMGERFKVLVQRKS